MIPRALGRLTRMETGIRGLRELGGGAEITVSQGQPVEPETVLGRTKTGSRVVRLPLDEGEIAASTVLKRPGESVRRGEPLMRKATLLGLGNVEYVCPVDGYIEEILLAQRALLIREQTSDVRAGVWGEVAAVEPDRGVVLRFDGTVLRFFAGWGPSVSGILTPGVELFSPADVSRYVTEEHRARVLWANSTVCAEAVIEAARVEVAGIVAGSIAFTELMRAAAEISSRTGRSRLPLTLLISEGFGSRPMGPLFRRHLSGAVGRTIYLDNPLAAAAGWGRDPEVAFSPPRGEGGAAPAPRSRTRSLQGDAGSKGTVGSPVALRPRLPAAGEAVRLVDLDYFGQHGVFTGQIEEQRLSTGVVAQVAQVTLDEGAIVSVPVANLELLGPAAE